MKHRLFTFATGAVGLGSVSLFLSGCGGNSSSPAASEASAEAPVEITLQTDWYAQAEHGGFYQIGRAHV